MNPGGTQTRPTSDDAAQRQPTSVRMRGLRKRFGATRALDGLDLEARGGEILGIAGPNGAGKSTMVGVLAGETELDEGTVEIDGELWNPALDGPVVVIHQEPQLFGNLTVAENLVAGVEDFKIGVVRLTPEQNEFVTAFELDGVVDHEVASIPLGQRQRVEILRALMRDARVVLFDEPNSALAPHESVRLFEEMHRLADDGKVVLLVSHRLAELAEHCERVAIIRDGTVHTVLEGQDNTAEHIAATLVAGTDVADRRAHRISDDRRSLLTVDQWTHKRGAFSIDHFEVAGDEVCAITGFEGAGGREFVRSLAGFEPTHGSLTAAGPVEYVTGDRQDSLFTNLSVEENLVVRSATDYSGPLGWWRFAASREAAQRAAQRFDIKAADVSDPIRSLSGGNQQKVAIASALMTEPTIVALEEPTRGVDVGAKSEIYAQLHDFAGTGGAVVMFCTEESEILECADRVVAMRAGEIVADRRVSEFGSIEELASFLAGVADDTGADDD